MSPGEGVIKFQLQHRDAPALPATEILELDQWRNWMAAQGLIGEMLTPDGPVCFGNISRRTDPGFIITGSQTGGLPQLTPNDFCQVTACRLEENIVLSQGPTKPSSEALTHAAVYNQDAAIDWVLHGHHTALWEAAARLSLPVSHPAVAYGTPEMAEEVARLFQQSDAADLGIFVMGGHSDGVISYGKTAEAAAMVLAHYLRQVAR